MLHSNWVNFIKCSYCTSKIMTGIILCVGVVSTVNADNRTLSNLERERAAMIGAFTNEQLTLTQREQQIGLNQRRLMDMERMVIRDDRLLGASDPFVKKAFDHYEMTFLVHASAEANQHLVDFWLQQLQLDSEQILTSKKGRR